MCVYIHINNIDNLCWCVGGGVEVGGVGCIYLYSVYIRAGGEHLSPYHCCNDTTRWFCNMFSIYEHAGSIHSFDDLFQTLCVVHSCD